MTLPLRDRLYGDTGLVITGATVQALLVTGGGTPAGVSSVLSASTTTDVNGVWAFAALADPGAGNWYDVKIINGQQVRWRYGNIQSLLATVALQASFTATAAQVWDFTASAGILRASDPRMSGQCYIGVATQTLGVPATSQFEWRFTKAYGGTLTINCGTAVISIPGATVNNASTYTSPNGESINWYCDGTNWWGL